MSSRAQTRRYVFRDTVVALLDSRHDGKRAWCSDMPTPSRPQPLPTALLGEPPSVKLLYLWLVHNGEVDLSQREISAALGITQANVSTAVSRLVELQLVARDASARPRVRVPISAVS